MKTVPIKSLDSLTYIVEAYRLASNRLLLLDYDGTLVSFTPRPEQAKPSLQVLSAIKKLASDRHNTVIIISGRDRSSLDSWLGHLPIQLIAEHGAFKKDDGGWREIISLRSIWKEKVQSIMLMYVQKVPGALIEEKETALVYHYRDAINKADARNNANILFKKLKSLAQELDLHITHASRMVEARQNGMDKGQSALSSLASSSFDFVVCAGDSRTDEDMFAKMTDRAFCIKVGPGKTAATYKVKSPEAFLDFLTSLATIRE